MANNTSSALTFTSPAGTTIADFALTRQIGYTNPVAANTHKYFLFYALGPTVFAGAGNYYDPTRNALNAQKQWYGYPDNNVAVAKSAVTRASFPALAGYKGDATTLAAARRLLQPRHAVLGGRRRRDQPHPARLATSRSTTRRRPRSRSRRPGCSPAARATARTR